MSHLRRFGFDVALGALLMVACALSPQTGQATISRNFDGGTGALIIYLMGASGQQNCTITSDSATGQVVVTDEAGALTSLSAGEGGPMAPASVKSIAITGSDQANIINYTNATPNYGWTSLSIGKCTVHANGGNDQVTGSNNIIDIIYGGDGNDSISGQNGNDIIYGENGDDTLDGNANNDTLYGGEGADTLNGGNNADVLYGDSGVNVLNGGNGADTMWVTDPASSQTLNGGADVGVDLYNIAVRPNAGVTYTLAENGTTANNNTLNFDVYPSHKSDTTDIGDVISVSGYGSVNYTGITGLSTLNTKNIRPSVTYGGAALTVNLYSGSATITSSGVNAKINGKDPEGGAVRADAISQITVTCADTLGAYPNTIDLGAVSGAPWSVTTGTIITSAGGDDVVIGSAFADDITGGAGNDTLSGNAGNDTMRGGDGDDTLSGGAGDDELGGDLGVNTLFGGDGNDALAATDPANNQILNGEAGNDTFWIIGVMPNAGVTFAVDGSDGADTLRYDVYPGHKPDLSDSNPAGASGNLNVASKGTVTYAGIETKDIRPSVTFNAGTGLLDVLFYSGDTSVTVSGGNAKVDGWDPDSGVPAAASAIKQINVTCSDITDLGINFPNNVDLRQVTGANGFTATWAAAGNVVKLGDGPNTFYGSDFNDVVTAGAGKDIMVGYNGNDKLTGGNGNDTLDAGEGDDDINGGGGANTLFGGNGNDTLRYPNSGNTKLDGGAGNDTYLLSAVPATVATSATIVDSSAGVNVLYYDVNPYFKSDVAKTGGGGYTIRQVDAAGWVFWPNGAIAAETYRPDVTFNAGTGLLNVLLWKGNALIQPIRAVDNIVYVEINRKNADNGSGTSTTADLVKQIAVDCDDTTFGGKVNICDLEWISPAYFTQMADNKTRVILQGGADISSGTAFADTIDAGAGADTVLGLDGDDVLFGGAGNTDLVEGGAGNDTITYLAGDGNNDVLYGGPGDDVFNAQAPNTAAWVLTIDGGDPVLPASPGDTLNFDGTNRIVDLTTGPLESQGVFSGPAVGTATYTSIETLTTKNTNPPILDYTPNPPFVNAAFGTTGTNTLSILNTGRADLTVTYASIFNWPDGPGAFSFADGDLNTTVVLGLPGETSNSITKTIQFYNTTAPKDEPATATIEIISWNYGVPDTSTSFTVYGYGLNDFTWNGNVSGWDTATEWTPQGVPGREDTAIIHTGQATRPRTLVVDSLWTTRDNAVTSLSLTGGRLSITGSGSNFTIGNNTVANPASFTQEGGSIDVGQHVQIANASGLLGTYNMIDGVLQPTVNLSVGLAGGTGVFNMTTGSISLTGTTGAFNIPTGVNSRGTFTMQNGTINVASHILLGTGGGQSSGTVIMNGGTVIQSPASAQTNIFANSTNSKGQWTQNGGAFRSGNALILANANGSRATYFHNGGSVSVGGLDLATTGGAIGTYQLGGSATLAVNDQIQIASGLFGGTGTFIQNGGTVAAGRIYAAYGTGTGTMNVLNGTATANTAVVGRLGAGALDIGTSATVRLTGDLAFGGDGTDNGGTGSFSLTSGTLSSRGIVAYGPAPISSWSWAGGRIETSTITLPIAVTNNGGVLAPGGESVASLVMATTYSQVAGAIEIAITSAALADQVAFTSGASTIVGDINILNDGEPANAGPWDIIVARDGGAFDITSATIHLPAPPDLWVVTSDSTKVRVRYLKPATLDAPTTVTFPLMILARGDTVTTAIFEIGNVGAVDLGITAMNVSGDPTFTLISPVDFPTTLTPYLEDGSTAPVTMEFVPTTSGLFLGRLDVVSNDRRTTVPVALSAEVLATWASASNVEAWTRY